jgi:hypothetical protein
MDVNGARQVLANLYFLYEVFEFLKVHFCKKLRRAMTLSDGSKILARRHSAILLHFSKDQVFLVS